MQLDNTLILMQYAQGMGAEEEQLRQQLGISKLRISACSPAEQTDQ